MNNNQARDLALAASAALVVEPTSLVSYQSKGRILILGDDILLQNWQVDALDVSKVSSGETGDEIEIEGYLGQYQLRIRRESGETETYQCDAIVDLHEKPVLRREMLPPGYFHAPGQDWKESGLVEELENIGGVFEKPKYFDYDASICAHDVNGKTACRACIDACPAEAIESMGDRIEVNPYLCQGGGSCSTVCPSGAIRYLYPQLADNGKRLRSMLQIFQQQVNVNPVVIFHSAAFSGKMQLPDQGDLLPFEVEELASVGADLCLSALSYGARQIIYCVDDQVPEVSRNSLRLQLQWMQALLAGLGLAADSVSLWMPPELPEILEPVDGFEAAIYDLPNSKRNAIYLAVNHLVQQMQPQSGVVLLPQGAPFGEVRVDAEKCTLCMACVGACPGKALQDGSNREIPELFFVEGNCLQCNGCVITCPEDAIELAPRFVLEQEGRNRSRVLNSDTPFACIACGKPFAPTSVIQKMQDKLKDHYMFSTERALDRLKMCDDCRVSDIVQDPDAMGGQFDPLQKFRK